jgi:energy-coupling factor transporter ATP-binding protein EcfA2
MEVGSGIHPELTGRENIWLYGSILGLGRRSIAARFDEIVEFAEIGEAIDRSVKYYSSGMQLRLGFSIASFLEPDIFVVDEALAVGDAGFQAKCVERMSSLVRSGVTLLFVSHNLPAIEGLCESGALLINGSVRDEGPVKSVLGSYLEWIDGSRAKEEAGPRGEGLIRLLSAKCFDATGAETYNFAPGDALTVKLHFECLEPVLRPQVNVGITDGRPGLLVQCSMLMDGEAPEKVSGQWECSLAITALPLRPRLYYIYCDIYDERAQGHIMSWIQAATFRISAPPNDGPLGVVGDFVAGPVIVPYKWEVRH